MKNKRTKTAEPRIDLTKYMVNADKPTGDNKEWGWCAGQQLEALKFYLNQKKVKFLAEECVGDYQGTYYAIFKVGKRYCLWRSGFGSCAGCDGLEGENGYEYIKDTLQEGNTRQFLNLKDAEEYVLTLHDDYWWDDCPISILEKARQTEKENL